MRSVRRTYPLVLALAAAAGCRSASHLPSGGGMAIKTWPKDTPACTTVAGLEDSGWKPVGKESATVLLDPGDPLGTRLILPADADRSAAEYRLIRPAGKLVHVQALARSSSGPVVFKRPATLVIGYDWCGGALGPDYRYTVFRKHESDDDWDTRPEPAQLPDDGGKPVAAGEIDHLSDYSIGTPRFVGPQPVGDR